MSSNLYVGGSLHEVGLVIIIREPLDPTASRLE